MLFEKVCAHLQIPENDQPVLKDVMSQTSDLFSAITDLPAGLQHIPVHPPLPSLSTMTRLTAPGID